MKITKSQLKQIIKEELNATIGEGMLDFVPGLGLRRKSWKQYPYDFKISDLGERRGRMWARGNLVPREKIEDGASKQAGGEPFQGPVQQVRLHMTWPPTFESDANEEIDSMIKQLSDQAMFTGSPHGKNGLEMQQILDQIEPKQTASNVLSAMVSDDRLGQGQ